MTTGEDAAKAALRKRQGEGARYDAPSAPAEALLQARRGTAYFARKLNELADADFNGPTAREGWSRAMLVAFVGLQARSLALAIEGLREGTSAALHLPTEEDLIRARTLSPMALRHLFQHAAKHLDVEWRDLSEDGWLANLGPIPVAGTPAARAEVVWHAGRLLVPGGRLSDLPAPIRNTIPIALSHS